MNQLPSLSQIGSRYQTTVTEFVFDGTIQQILDNDARRFYVRFEAGNGLSGGNVLPGPNEVPQSSYMGEPYPKEFKFRDCPSIVIGEFYGTGILASSIIVITCTYLD